MNKGVTGIMVCAVFLMLPQTVYSAPYIINYQGGLTDVSGRAVTGPVTMIFEIFINDTAGLPTSGVWSETHTDVIVQDGVFNVMLGSVNANTLLPGIFADDDRWLEVTVNGEILFPRQKLTSVAYAHNADLLDGVESTNYLNISNASPTTLSGALFLPANGLTVGIDHLVAAGDNVGIGTTSPGEKLDVNGNLFMSGGDLKTDRWLQSDTNTGIGVAVFGAGNLTHTAGREGRNNTAIGNNALFSNTTGNDNTANGSSALTNNTTGSSNTANGFNALSSNTTGNDNTANGRSALFSNTIGIDNTANGFFALALNTEGNFNTANGRDALLRNTTGNSNTANGNDALQENTTGSNNTANGFSALVSNTIGSFNTALGFRAGDNLTTGNQNIIIGYDIDAPVAIGSNQMSIGNLIYATGVDGTGTMVSTGNVGIGTTSPGEKLDVSGNLFMSGGDIKTDRWLQSDTNTGIGVNVFGAGNLAHTTENEGWENTAIGHGALFSNTTGSENTANGQNALFSNTTGSENTANGQHAITTNTTGNGNTATGNNALFSNTTGGSNTATGSNALSSNTTGGFNTATGFQALSFSTGSFNTALGYSAGDNLTTGRSNIIIGSNIDVPMPTGNNQMSIGNLIYATGVDGTGTTASTGNVGIRTNTPNEPLSFKNEIGTKINLFDDGVGIYGFGMASAEVQIGTYDETKHISLGHYSGSSRSFFEWMRVAAGGNVGIGTPSPGSFKLAVNGSAAKPGGGSWSTFSDIRLKEIIGTYEYGLPEVSNLEPVRYRYRGDNELGLSGDEEYIGLNAQEVQDIIPEAVEKDDNGYLLINNDPIIWAMLNAIKELKAQNGALRAINESFESRLSALESMAVEAKAK